MKKDNTLPKNMKGFWPNIFLTPKKIRKRSRKPSFWRVTVRKIAIPRI